MICATWPKTWRAGFRSNSERGVTAIEYGLIASLIALGIIAGVTLTGTNLAAIFNYVAPKLAAP